jgi:hypothetical protein
MLEEQAKCFQVLSLRAFLLQKYEYWHMCFQVLSLLAFLVQKYEYWHMCFQNAIHIQFAATALLQLCCISVAAATSNTDTCVFRTRTPAEVYSVYMLT